MKIFNSISALFVFILIFLSGCTDITTSNGLIIGSSNFNRVNSHGEFESVPDKVFDKGEIVYLMLFNVSGFEKGEDGLNSVDIDMQILTEMDSVIFEQKEMLGEKGHIDLENNIAVNPQTSFTPTSDISYGSYKFHIKIYDKISGNSASVTKSFSYN